MRQPSNDQKYKSACIQFEPEVGSHDRILDAMDAGIREAAAGASVAILPELTDSGYEFENTEDLKRLAAPIPDGATTSRLAGLRREVNLCVVSDTAEQRDDGRIDNFAVLCGPEGYIGTCRAGLTRSQRNFAGRNRHRLGPTGQADQ